MTVINGMPARKPVAKWFQLLLFLVSVGLPACASQSDTSHAFNYPFGKSTASAYYQALYDGALTQIDGTKRAIDLVTGGAAVDNDTYSLFNATSGPVGIFLGDARRAGAHSKLLRWWDYYGDGIVDYENSVQTAVGLVDFDNPRHAISAMRVEARRVNVTIDEVLGGNGIENWAESTEQGKQLVMFSVPPNESIVVFVSCNRYGTFETKAVCGRSQMSRLRDEIVARIPTASNEPQVADANFHDDGWKQVVSYEFDVEQMARSYLDPDGFLRMTWKNEQPSGGRYQWTGTSYAYSLASSDPKEPGLQVRADHIPIGSTDSAFKVVAKICFDQSNSRSPYCGSEQEVLATGALEGGRIAVAYLDPSTKVVQSVRAHLVTSRHFIDVHCGHPLTSDEQGLSKKEIDACKKAVSDLVLRVEP